MGCSTGTGSQCAGPKLQEALSRPPEGGPERGPCLPPPMGGGRSRMLTVFGWTGPLGWVPQCTAPRPQEAPAGHQKSDQKQTHAYLIVYVEAGLQLVDLHARYGECGLRILDFPGNQFGKQEPGSNQEIKEFAAGYDVKFDMYNKICVIGDDAHTLWKWMKVQPKGSGILANAIKWNFTKLLIDKNG
ncbi:glutathione peroxidase 4 [Cricetulus griseus]